MTEEAFLNVKKSCTGRRWTTASCNEREVEAIAQRLELPDIIAKCINARGISPDEAPQFLSPKLRDLLPDPNTFIDMDKAVDRFCVAIQNKEPIAIFGDYDVDGATSSALMARFARSLGNTTRLYIPDRINEGYGPNPQAMRHLADEGAKLVICVDCGATAHDALTAAMEAGLDVIVIDHHVCEPVLPPACAVVNPNRIDQTGIYGNLAAVGVTFLFVIAANRALRLCRFFDASCPEPDLMQWLDLVALGTVCDVVNLTGLNRSFVAQGLKIAAHRRNIGLVSLAQAAGISKYDAYAAGYVLGPRINAGGRIGESDLGAKLLSTDDPTLAFSLAQQLNTLNAERRDMEARVLAEAEDLTIQNDLPLAFVASEQWHPGVIGIVASRLKEKFRHPAIVIAIENGIGKGSCRSTDNIDMGALIIAAKQAGLLINGGGHKMAAGLTVAKDKIDALKDFLSERITKIMAGETIVPTLMLDGMISGQALSVGLVHQIDMLGPFGAGNAEPRFALPDCKIIRADIVAEKHVSLIFVQGGKRLKGIAFRAMENDLGPTLLRGQDRLHLAGHIRINEWQGTQSVQLHINDAAFADQ